MKRAGVAGGKGSIKGQDSILHQDTSKGQESLLIQTLDGSASKVSALENEHKQDQEKGTKRNPASRKTSDTAPGGKIADGASWVKATDGATLNFHHAPHEKRGGEQIELEPPVTEWVEKKDVYLLRYAQQNEKEVKHVPVLKSFGDEIHTNPQSIEVVNVNDPKMFMRVAQSKESPRAVFRGSDRQNTTCTEPVNFSKNLQSSVEGPQTPGSDMAHLIPLYNSSVDMERGGLGSIKTDD